jgi:hypothetical protein
VDGRRYWKVDKSVSGIDPWSMKYPTTPANLLPGTPVVLKALGGCLIATGVAAVVTVVLIFIGIRLVFNTSDSETRKSEHNANLLFVTFTGRAASARSGGGSGGTEAHAAGPLQGHPTPREEGAKAIEAFTATGYTPITTPDETLCSLASYPPSAYLPGEAPISVRVNCTWRAQRLPYSTASIEIEVVIPTVDLRPTLDSSGYFEPNVGLVEDLPLDDAYLDVTART